MAVFPFLVIAPREAKGMSASRSAGSRARRSAPPTPEDTGRIGLDFPEKLEEVAPILHSLVGVPAGNADCLGRTSPLIDTLPPIALGRWLSAAFLRSLHPAS
jgi:hypothetical protein